MDFDCITPLGEARCRGMFIDGDKTEWLTDIYTSREPWWWSNPNFRFGANVTDANGPPSPFCKPGRKLARQIERYKKSGWLPENYDPTKVETWKV